MRSLPGLTSLDRPLVTFLESNAHAFTRADLFSRWTRTALTRGLDTGNIVRVLPGIYSAQRHAKTPQVIGEALNLWHHEGLVTGPLALHLFDNELPMPTSVDLRVAHGFRPRTPEWVRCRQGEPSRQLVFQDGVRCAPPALALLDAWRFAAPRDRPNIFWEALWARVCTWKELAREVERAPRIAARRDLERMLRWFSEGATTPLEVRAKYETFADARFSDFVWQTRLWLGTRRVTVDMLHPATMVVVELDGDRYHSTSKARTEDRERQTLLTASGYTMVRFGWSDARDRPAWCREQLLAVLATRSSGPSRRPSGTG